MGRCQKCDQGQVLSDKVIYTGSYLPNLGIQSNTNLTTVLSIINTIFGSSSTLTIIKMESEEGTTITNQDFVGKTVELIVIDDITKNSGFTKNTSSSVITLTDVILTTGQNLTIFLS